jgi:sulfide:quinone oxidoreductase
MTARPRIVILGAGFGGLELSTILSETLGDGVDVTLIDKADAFMFGFSKLDVMFGHTTVADARMPYRNFAKPGVRLLQETVTAIDAQARQVTTDRGVHQADYLVVALGAEYDMDGTPGLATANEFYSVAGAERLAALLPAFTKGRALIGVCGAPYKCPPAPSECALMLHDYLLQRGVRAACEIDFVLPLPSPVPPSPETSRALEAAFAERGIAFHPGRRVASIEGKVAILDDGTPMPFDLFLGVPKHRVPKAVLDSGLAEGGWIPVNPRTLETRFANVFAVGDGANTGTPKAGVFAEGAAKAVASALVDRLRGGGAREYDGLGTCYIEFGAGRIGKVQVDFFSGSKPVGTYYEPSVELRVDKEHFGASRRARWFGM